VTGSRERLRWLMIGLAFFATVINYLDRQTLSVVAPVLLDQFHMDSVDYSRVVSAFLLAYTVMNGVSGPVIDRLGTRAGYALCMLWWSASSVLHVFATGTLSLGVCRFLLGMGEAGNWPGALKVVAEWFPEKERALASGIFNSGATVGVILAPPVIVSIVRRFGWQAAFLSIGALGFVWLIAWLAIYRTPTAVSETREMPRAPQSVGQLLRMRFVWSFTLSKVFLDPAWYFYIFWFPQYLKQVHKFNLAAIGKYAWIPFFVAALGNMFGGFLSPAFMRRGMETAKARKLAVTVCAVLMMFSIPAVLSASPGSDWVRGGGDGWVHRGQRDATSVCGGCVFARVGGFGLGLCRHGGGIRRDAVHASGRVGDPAFLIRPRFYWIRAHSAGLFDNPMDVDRADAKPRAWPGSLVRRARRARRGHANS
jgi:ACS family hexuronate transporter-like MFS transporter